MDTILQREQYILIYRVSYFSLISSLYALYRGHYHLVMVPASVFLSSINYWRKPDYSYRRYLDMIVVKTAVSYQHYMVYNTDNAMLYYAIVYIGLLSYPIGIYYYNKGDYWKSTYFHIFLHIISNIGNIVLYSSNLNNST